MCYQSPDWVDKLPLILLGFRSTFKEDIKSTPAEMVYGTTLRIPGQFFQDTKPTVSEGQFVKDFRRVMDGLRPTQTSKHGDQKTFIQKQLSNCTHVFIRNDTVRHVLVPPYDGPYES
ncbi:hypothetical protein HA402_000959 [Bradysia odoriphaga]|nr:hypothetical protein HA402_000959 [Bradysia odoriphaga]